MIGLVVYCADIGSVRRDKFGWARASTSPNSCVKTGTNIRCLVTQVAQDLNQGKKVALGFECPLWVPVACDPNRLTSRRCGEGRYPWAAGAGATSLAAGLTETARILSGIRNETPDPDVKAYLEWPLFEAAEHGLFLWEAMVTGAAAVAARAFIKALTAHEKDAVAACAFIQALTAHEKTAHEKDAAVAACAFIQALPAPTACNAITSPHRVRSLIGAALLWAGWSRDIQLLDTRCLVIRP